MASRKERALQQVLEECTKEEIMDVLMGLCDCFGMYEATLQAEERPRIKHALVYLREIEARESIWQCCALVYSASWDKRLNFYRKHGTRAPE